MNSALSQHIKHNNTAACLWNVNKQAIQSHSYHDHWVDKLNISATHVNITCALDHTASDHPRSFRYWSWHHAREPSQGYDLVPSSENAFDTDSVVFQSSIIFESYHSLTHLVMLRVCGSTVMPSAHSTASHVELSSYNTSYSMTFIPNMAVACTWITCAIDDYSLPWWLCSSTWSGAWYLFLCDDDEILIKKE